MPLPKESDLIESLYDAALGHRSWDSATSSVACFLGGETLMLSVLDPKDLSVEIVSYRGLTANNVQEYLQFAHHDPWLARVTENRLFNKAVIGTEIVEERELLRSYMYNEFLRPRTRVHHLVGSVLKMEDGRVGIIGTHRPRDAKDFVPHEAGQLGRLLPHLRRALEIRQRLRLADRTSQSIYSTLDRLSLGTIILSATGRLLHVNMVADAILCSGDGLNRTPDGLRASNKEDDKRLQTLIAGLCQSSADVRSSGGHLRIQRPSGQQSYAVMLAPAGSIVVNGGKAAPTVLVFVSDPGEKLVSDIPILTQLFGFTPAESRLVMALLSGVSPPDFARQAGVTHNTVRTLLSRAMARTEARSQLELVLQVTRAIGATR